VEWRRVLRTLHREIGYLLFGLVIAYAISGLAVNHVEDWNPSYSVSRSNVALGALPAAGGLDAMEAYVVQAAGLDPDEVTGRRRPGDDAFVVFLRQGGEVNVSVATGEGTMERVTTRPGLFEMNVLHLNHLKGAWTVVADVFAVLLAFLAVTGIVMLRGRHGLAGRGKWLVLAGLLLPVGFLVHYHLTR